MNTAEHQIIAAARSFLFVPGDRPERVVKAAATSTDVIVLDLEDAVSAPRKEFARLALRELDITGFSERLIVRVNAADTSYFEADLEACSIASVAGIMLSKAEAAHQVEQAGLNGGRPVIALIESARGLDALAKICSTKSCARLAFGSIDFCLDLGIAEDGIGLAMARSQLVLQSALMGLPSPVEGVTANFRDETALANDLNRAKAFGFSAKLAIHPQQVDPINLFFRPTTAEIEWANRIVSVIKTSGDATGAVAFQGEMIDRPVILRASRILAAAGISNCLI